MQYGSQTVPITADLERLLAFKAAKGMQLLGFVTHDPVAPLVPRHTFMSVRRRRTTLAEASPLCQRMQDDVWPQHRRPAEGRVHAASQCIWALALSHRTATLNSGSGAACRTSGSWHLTRRTSGRGLPWRRWSPP